jgi:hypothetical protein
MRSIGVLAVLVAIGCGGASAEDSGSAAPTSGGAGAGQSNASGAASQGGKGVSGGGSGKGGATVTGGTIGVGGATSSTGGRSAGGNANTGGIYEVCLVCGGWMSLGGTKAMGGTATGGSTNGSTGGSSSQGGNATGGQTATPICSDPDATMTNASKVVSTTIGTNGSFTDTCDSNGNLLEYRCETACNTYYNPGLGGASGVPVGIACLPQPTGKVLPATIDCAGRCSAGHCFEWCPNFSDTVTLVNVGSTGQTIRTAPGYDLGCKVVFTQSGYDCQAASLSGTQVKVVALGACGSTSSTFGTALPNSSGNEACTFECQVTN